MRGRFEDTPIANATLIEALGFDIESATLSSDAATVSGKRIIYKITSESKTTAHTASATFVITRTGTTSTDVAFCIPNGGTNTQGVPTFKAVCTTDTVTVTLLNGAIATNAFNGTFIFMLVVLKNRVGQGN